MDKAKYVNIVLAKRSIFVQFLSVHPYTINKVSLI